jgi:hypothetical protein
METPIIKSKKNKIIYDDDEDDEYEENTCAYISSDEDYDSEYKTSSEFKSETKLETKSKKKLVSITKIRIDDSDDKLTNQHCTNCKVNHELLHIVYELNNKLDNVENELKELKEIIKRKTITTNGIPPINKKNVVDWLNNYVVPTISFDDFIENLLVNMSHFEFLLEYKLPDTIQRIIQTNIVKNTDIVYPLYSTIEKSGKVYVFTEDDTWDVISIEYLIKFVKQIENKLSQHCIDWKTNNNGKNNFNSESQERCQNAIVKLYNISYTQDTMMNRVKHDMCIQLKSVCK